MTFGLVISSYKYGHLAAHAIESALSQTRKFDKIWFVDDGAYDCRHLWPIYEDRLEFVYRDRNIGIINNFNDMLNFVMTDYVMFLGADNWLRSDALEQIEKSFIEHEFMNPKVCVYDIQVTGELRDEIYRCYPQQMRVIDGDWYWTRKGFHHGSMVYHVKTAKDMGGYEHNKTSSRTDEDHNLWNKFINAGHKTIHLDLPLLYYRRHKENFNKY